MTLAACGGPTGAQPVSTTTTPYLFYNDGHTGSIVTRRENVFDRDMKTYDVRDLDRLHGAVEVTLLRLPDLAREFGATHADLSEGTLWVAGPERTQSLMTEMLAMLRASPGPR